MKKQQWLNVDRDGLRKLIMNIGKGRLIAELVQNALDENVTKVRMTLVPIPGRRFAVLSVEDDSPDGFHDLAHAFTLFAESCKKADPRKRGRFNLGEKLVLAMCESATLATTTGTVIFGLDENRRVNPRKKRERGSEFKGVLAMTRKEYEEACQYLRTLLIPSEVSVTLNGELVPHRQAIHSFEVTLPTVVADGEGVMRERTRKTMINLYDPLAGECPMLYELGLPVVQLDDKWHCNVLQKVPLNLNRDNVPPAFLRTVRTVVLNAMHDRLTPEDACEPWVQAATAEKRCSPEAITRVMDLRFGEQRAVYDPSDPEANKAFQAQGGTIVPGGGLSKGQWNNVKKAGAIRPAGQLCPTRKPYSDDPDAVPEHVIPRDQWTEPVRKIAAYATFLASELMGVQLTVRVTRVPNNFLACYGSKQLTFNLQHLGHNWFNEGVTEAVDGLLIHEFGHEFCGDHLSSEYYKALCRLGARLKRLALEKPDAFRPFAKES